MKKNTYSINNVSYSIEVELPETERLPSSARTVADVLQKNKLMTLDNLLRITGLPRRTLMFAISRLREAELIDVQTCFSDLRRKFYGIRMASKKERQ